MTIEDRFSVRFGVQVAKSEAEAHDHAQQTPKIVNVSLDFKRSEFSRSPRPKKQEAKKILDSMFTLDKIVPDIIWSEKSPCDDEDDLSIMTKEELETTTSDGTILVILESPHREEYQNEGFIRRFPARGSAGKGISKHIASVLGEAERLLKNGELCSLPVVVANPVQYQTSLNFLLHNGKRKKINANLRNEVWCRLFAIKEIRDDFYLRVCDYQPTAILNACTTSLKWNVTHFLLERQLGCPILHISHPSSNGWSEGRRNVKVVVPSH